MVNTEGHLVSILATNINQILVHDLVAFPLRADHLSADTPWYQVSLLDAGHSQFEGMPIQFIDDLALFINKFGNLEVITLQQIASLQKVQAQDLQWRGKPVSLDYSSARLRCGDLPIGTTVPSRVLGDPVQISEFLGNYETGFEKFDNLFERMSFYSRPLLKPPSTRMGFPVLAKNPETIDKAVMNFKISSGIPFGLQSSSEFLSIQNDWVPFYFPVMGANFELKSHLFHAALVVHLPSVAGGAKYFDNALSLNSEFQSPQGYYLDDKEPLVLSHSFNYLTMFGIDYKAWTFSFGGYYPIQYAFINGNTREILTSSPQPVLRIIYSGEKFQIRANGSQFKMDHNSSGKNYSLIAYSNFSKMNNVTGSSDGSYLRLGFDYELGKIAKLKIDLMDHHWQYMDSLLFTAKANESTYAIALSKDFGKYVGLKAYLANISYRWSGFDANTSTTKTINDNIYGGEFEFIF